jgi:hypothetical protein
MQYAFRIILPLFVLACSLGMMLDSDGNDGGWGWNLTPLFGTVGLVAGVPISFWIGKRIDNSWFDG